MTEAMNNFNLFLKSHIVELLNSIESFSFDDLIDIKDISKVLNNKERLLEYDSSLKDEIDLLLFFYEQGVTESPQTQGALSTIFESLKKSNSKVSILSKEKDECEKILNGEDFDFDFFVSILEKSGLSEKEKLELLSNQAHKSCFINIKNENGVKKEEVIESKETKKLVDLDSIEDKVEEKKVTKKIEDLSVKELISRYNFLKPIISNMNKMYYDFIKDKTESQIKYYESYANLVPANEKEMVQFKEYRLIVCLFRLLKYKDQIEELINGQVDREILALSIMEIEELLKEINVVGKELVNENKEKDLSNVRKTNFFTMDGFIPYFDVSKLNGDEKRISLNILTDIENGILDSTSVSSRKVIMESSHPFNVYVYLKNKLGISYIKVGKDKILVLTMDNLKNIYTETISLVNKYEKQINAQMKLIQESNKEYTQNQDKMLTSIKNSLPSERKM